MSPTQSALEQRVRRLERSVRILRITALSLLLLVGVAGLSAFAAEEEVQAERLVLEGAGEEPGVVLRAGPGSSLILESPDGYQLMRLGGPAARHMER